MTEIAVDSAASKVDSVSTPKKGKGVPKVKVVKAKKSKPDHPSTSEMVLSAIRELKETKGSSLQAIKKYISVNYSVDGDKVAPFIRKYISKAAETGLIVRVKGKGASGSFKLPNEKGSAGTKRSVKNSQKTKTAVATKSPTKAAKKPAKKTVKKAAPVVKEPVVVAEPSPKAVVEKKSKVAAKTAAVKKSPSKAKTVKAAPVAKPKAPKPKTIKASPARKRGAPKKK